ncbi:TGS domain-containing protein [Candidatus Bathyarchaeota archaeon]|nr:TGS domain-containing protein [Candidatus Bathyarchaeota archaeon]
MPANLTAEAKSKWNKVVLAKDPEEKLKALQEFLSSIPKHKGNEKLRAQIKRKIALLKVELEERKRSKKGVKPFYLIDKEGAAAQIIILGLTNVGKSSLLSALTNANPGIDSRPYFTAEPAPGVMDVKDIHLQLIEAPALTPGSSNSMQLALAKKADGLILMVDALNNPYTQLKIILKELEKSRISIKKLKSKIEMDKDAKGGLQIAVFGKLNGCVIEDVKKLLLSYGVRKGIVKIWGEASLEEIENYLLELSNEYKPTVILVNKCENISEEKLIEVKDLTDDVPIITISCLFRKGLEKIGEALVKKLEIIRVYTKEPNEKEASKEPVILKEGATIGDLAKEIHSELYKNFKYAKVWGPSSKFPGEKVGLNHLLKDGDSVEIHIR